MVQVASDTYLLFQYLLEKCEKRHNFRSLLKQLTPKIGFGNIDLIISAVGSTWSLG